MLPIGYWCALRPEEDTSLPEVESQMVVSHQVGSRNCTQILCKSRKCCLPLVVAPASLSVFSNEYYRVFNLFKISGVRD